MLINQIASVLRIIAFINLFGWMLYLGVVMNAQSKAVKVWLKCKHCGQEFSKTKKEIEKFQYQLVDNQLAYQCKCPHCHQTEWQTVVQHHPGNDQETLIKANQTSIMDCNLTRHFCGAAANYFDWLCAAVSNRVNS